MSVVGEVVSEWSGHAGTLGEREISVNRDGLTPLEADRIPLPDRRLFKLEVEAKQRELEADAGSRTEIAAARRRAVVEILSKHGLLAWTTDVSTDSAARTGTN
jgi:hypothetical protein